MLYVSLERRFCTQSGYCCRSLRDALRRLVIALQYLITNQGRALHRRVLPFAPLPASLAAKRRGPFGGALNVLCGNVAHTSKSFALCAKQGDFQGGRSPPEFFALCAKNKVKSFLSGHVPDKNTLTQPPERGGVSSDRCHWSGGI